MEMSVTRKGMGARALIGKAILIAGPTASGKSALALEMAARRDGVVVNADSMQVYSVLRVLTARPGEAELGAAPHLLYGHVDPGDKYSTGKWLGDVRRLAETGAFGGRIPIFVGGTGLYFRALLGGLAPMPAVPTEISERWRRSLAREGPLELHCLLRKEDPEAALQIEPADGQRIVRALEVLETSGRSILAWRAQAAEALVDPGNAERILLEPDRKLVGERIERRFERMVEEGAVGEVEALLALRLDPSLPAMKAIGVREIAAALEGRYGMEKAVDRAKAATRQYAKRQATWFRHQMGPEWRRRGA
jgi:tRNA dimethylallyltransferase